MATKAPSCPLERLTSKLQAIKAEIDKQGEKSFRQSMMLWVQWPSILGNLRGEAKLSGSNQGDLVLTTVHPRGALFHAHRSAEFCLVREAKRRGLPGGKLHEAGQYCRQLIHTGYLVHGLGYSGREWPEFLGHKRYELPEKLQDAIADAEAVVCELGVMLSETGAQRVPVNIEHGEVLSAAINPGDSEGKTTEVPMAIDSIPVPERNGQFLKWREELGLTDAQIRDKWDEEHPEQKTSGGRRGSALVKTGIKRAKILLHKNKKN